MLRSRLALAVRACRSLLPLAPPSLVLRGRNARGAARPLSTPPPEAGARPAAPGQGSAPAPPAWVTQLNGALAAHPVETAGAYIALDILSIGALYHALALTAVAVPADFALAFAISRLLRRFRLPLDIAAAGVLARIYPPLTLVRPSRLLGLSLPEAAPATSAAGAAPAPAAAGGFLQRAGAAFASAVDRYGLALLVAQRLVGLVSVSSLFALMRAGVDVQASLASYGLDLGGAGTVVGTWAAAAVLASSLYPAVILAAGPLGARMGAMRLALSAGAK